MRHLYDIFNLRKECVHHNEENYFKKNITLVPIKKGLEVLTSPTLESNSWLSGGCFFKLCGKMTVNKSGLSALKAPRITAAFVPDAPDVKIWFFCTRR